MTLAALTAMPGQTNHDDLYPTLESSSSTAQSSISNSKGHTERILDFRAAPQVLKDLSDPDNGVYSLSDALEDRLSYVQWQMKNILCDPVMKVSMLSKGTPPSAPRKLLSSPLTPDIHYMDEFGMPVWRGPTGVTSCMLGFQQLAL